MDKGWYTTAIALDFYRENMVRGLFYGGFLLPEESRAYKFGNIAVASHVERFI
jgi:hypothetical protein